MTWAAFQRRFPRSQWPRYVVVLYLLALLIFSFAALLRYPIRLLDTDLWFQLDYGRYLFQHHAIPHSTFFSFISPSIEFVDHPWLFQALVYFIYSAAGYIGLIMLRSVVYLAIGILIFRYVFKMRDCSQSIWWPAVVVALYDMLLFARCFNIRPYLVSSLFLIGFLYLLESKSRKTAYLPLLAILWCNLHGAFYPVMVWICLSYSCECLVERFQERISPHEARSLLVSLVLSMATIYATPFGLRLLPLPFMSLTYGAQYVKELAPLHWAQLLTFHMTSLAPSAYSLLSFFLIVTCFAAIRAVWERTLRISHLLLAVGGCILLSKGERFYLEFAFLVLPLLKFHPPFRASPLSALAPTPSAILATTLTMIIPVMFCRSLTPTPRAAYPISSGDFPRGVDAFLNQLPAQGRVFNHPNTGGYHRWMLDSRYKIFADMEFPGIPIEYLYLATYAFSGAETLRQVLVRYDPSFITVPIPANQFKSVIQQFPNYVLVFFDDLEVLYVNQKQYPMIAAQYAVKGFDPFALALKTPDQVGSEAIINDLLPQLARLISIYPEAEFTNYVAATMLNRDGAYDRAIPYAETIIKVFPESPLGFWALGDAWKGLRDDDKALSAYEQAWRRAGEAQRDRIGRAMGAIYSAQRRYEKAYQTLSRSIDIFSPKVNLDDLYHLGVAAREAGKRQEAHAIFRYMHEFRLAPTDGEWLEKIKGELN